MESHVFNLEFISKHDSSFQNGIQMKDGEFIEADFIIAATGLTMQPNFPFSTVQVSVDGQTYNASEHVIYNGIMLDNVPNFAFIMGYTNASWTLRADISSLYFTQLLNYMHKRQIVKAMPKIGSKMELEAFNGGLSSGYISRAKGNVPKQGDTFPWNTGANSYLVDLFRATFQNLCIDSMEFTYSNKKND